MTYSIPSNKYLQGRREHRDLSLHPLAPLRTTVGRRCYLGDVEGSRGGRGWGHHGSLAVVLLVLVLGGLELNLLKRLKRVLGRCRPVDLQAESVVFSFLLSTSESCISYVMYGMSDRKKDEKCTEL